MRVISAWTRHCTSHCMRYLSCHYEAPTVQCSSLPLPNPALPLRPRDLTCIKAVAMHVQMFPRTPTTRTSNLRCCCLPGTTDGSRSYHLTRLLRSTAGQCALNAGSSRVIFWRQISAILLTSVTSVANAIHLTASHEVPARCT